MAHKKIEFLMALRKVIDHLEMIHKNVASGTWDVEMGANKLRNRSIELGTISCMPFREDKPKSKCCAKCGAFNAERPDLLVPNLTRCSQCGQRVM